MYRRYVKRVLDILISLIALPFFLIILLFVAPAIKSEDGGPVFYNAPRVGIRGKMFKMYKFRSMKVNSPDLKMPDGSTYNAPDDPRMTKVGAFLRRTSIDEVPQILNVLKGDMSLIGPRPDLLEETELYEGDEGRKLEVLPGITGYAQVYGRNSIPWKERLALDVKYVEEISFRLDTCIFFRTFSSIVSQKGVFTSPIEGTDAAEDGIGESRAGYGASEAEAVGIAAESEADGSGDTSADRHSSDMSEAGSIGSR